MSLTFTRAKMGIFGIIPLLVLQDKRQSINSLKVFIALSSFQGTAAKSWPKRDEIAKRAGLSMDGTEAGLARLKATGWIITKRRGQGRSNEYIIALPVDIIRDHTDGRSKNRFIDAGKHPVSIKPLIPENIRPLIPELIREQDTGINPGTLIIEKTIENNIEKTSAPQPFTPCPIYQRLTLATHTRKNLFLKICQGRIAGGTCNMSRAGGLFCAKHYHKSRALFVKAGFADVNPKITENFLTRRMKDGAYKPELNASVN